MLGCLISFPEYFGDIYVFSSNKGEIKTITDDSITEKNSNNDDKNLLTTENDSENDDLSVDFITVDQTKDLIINSLISFDDDPTNINSRSVILSALTCFIYDEILNRRWHPRLDQAIKYIFKQLQNGVDDLNLVLVKICCDNIRFLSVLADLIFQKKIQFAVDIMNVVNPCVTKLFESKPSTVSEDYERAIISMMFTLLEWFMNMPLSYLSQQNQKLLVKNNFKLIIRIANLFSPHESSECEHIHLTARFILIHLLSYLDHFPLASTGPFKIVSTVNETSDLDLNINELSPVLFNQSNVQFFTVNNHFLISFIELPMKNNEKYFNLNDNLKKSPTICRFIIRDFCGKNCWDCCLLNSPDINLPTTYLLDIPFLRDNNSEIDESQLFYQHEDGNQFDYYKLPFLNLSEIPKDVDILDSILKYVNYSSPECRLGANRSLNTVWELSAQLSNLLKVEEIKQQITNQSTHEHQHNQQKQQKDRASTRIKQKQHNNQTISAENNTESVNTKKIESYFQLCKSFVHQMGLLSWEKRQSFNILRKTPQLLRELKNLDDQTCRETHKIALIYIGEGQIDKLSILSNEIGSEDYEDFLGSLAWCINLETHEGFMGGLQHNYQFKTGSYFSNSVYEVMFHVSTRMTSQNDPNKISKWRHLGNDSVQIIWSEHNRDYDRNILSTEFADVIICIYPLRNGLYRIQITKKPSVIHLTKIEI
jgi:hypothetical protein